jgi:hypothetical protein
MPLLWPFLWATLSVDQLQSIPQLMMHCRPPVSHDAFERALQRVELDRAATPTPNPNPASTSTSTSTSTPRRLPPSLLTQSLVPPPRAKRAAAGVRFRRDRFPLPAT